MDLTTSHRTTTATAAVVMASGLAAILYGVVRGDPARSIAGVGLTMIALTLIALTAIRRWVTNTSDERRRLAAAIRAADDERTKCFADRAALENERQRILIDAATDRARSASALIAEREKLAAEFEEKRAALICETLTTVAGLLHSQKKQPQRGSIIPFPAQQPVRAPEMERSRGHNVVGP